MGGLAQWNAALVALSTADTRTGGIIAHAKWAAAMAQDYRTEGIETQATVVENTQPSCK